MGFPCLNCFTYMNTFNPYYNSVSTIIRQNLQMEKLESRRVTQLESGNAGIQAQIWMSPTWSAPQHLSWGGAKSALRQNGPGEWELVNSGTQKLCTGDK